MYIPNDNLSEDKEEIIAFMRKYSFATIISAKDNFPIATHLPFIITENDDELVLISHFAKANQQWTEIVENQVLVIFSEPHAYISPKHYEKELSVPTWNYIAVHAYGKAEIITEVEKSFDVLEKMIDSYEADYKTQWSGLPMDYKMKMLNGIVTFQMTVTDLQAKWKLSQNKTNLERQRIIETLSGSAESGERQIAAFMQKEID
jgi:transcriptional regulator